MLSERQLLILEMIIREYTNNGQPIGSKTLSDNPIINASSATVRNEMSYLEKLGYIEKTHTSSGRVPSLKGYRFYVDHFMKPKKVEKEKLALISQVFKEHVYEMDDLMNHSAQLLSELTNYTGIILGPEAKKSRLTGFRLVPLNNQKIMAIIQTDTGAIENLVFEASQEVDYSDIHKVTNIFNDHLVGHTLIEVYRKLQMDIPSLIQKYASNTQDIFSSVENILNKSQEDRLHISGKTNLLDFTENMKVAQIKSLYESLENEVDLNTLIHQVSSDLDIRIGHELNHDLFQDFSLITTVYHVEGHGNGIIAVLGPTNMSYDKTLGVMNAFRTELAERLLRYYLE